MSGYSVSRAPLVQNPLGVESDHEGPARIRCQMFQPRLSRNRFSAKARLFGIFRISTLLSFRIPGLYCLHVLFLTGGSVFDRDSFHEDTRPQPSLGSAADEALWFLEFQCSAENCGLHVRLHTTASADANADDVTRTICLAIEGFRCADGHKHLVAHLWASASDSCFVVADIFAAWPQVPSKSRMLGKFLSRLLVPEHKEPELVTWSPELAEDEGDAQFCKRIFTTGSTFGSRVPSSTRKKGKCLGWGRPMSR